MITVLKVSLLLIAIVVTVPIVFLIGVLLFGESCEIVIHRSTSLKRIRIKWVRNLLDKLMA